MELGVEGCTNRNCGFTETAAAEEGHDSNGPDSSMERGGEV